jgi:hypothetical protein
LGPGSIIKVDKEEEGHGESKVGRRHGGSKGWKGSNYRREELMEKYTVVGRGFFVFPHPKGSHTSTTRVGQGKESPTK